MPLDALEYVVRPYTTPNAHGSIIIPSTPRGTQERATLTWGKDSAITVPTPKEVSDGVNFEVVCCQEQLNELDRKSDQKRVFQRGDEDSENWVDVERPKSLRLKKKEKNKCFGPGLTDTSDVAQQINAVNADFEYALNSGVTSTHMRCSVNWTFKNTK
jgi:hypothetical protein